MSSTSVGQLMADMRQLVINLQARERATDNALAKSQVVSEKISGMKEYQEEVANMNDCWRMQGRKVLVAGLQHENRQILQLQQENRELRQVLEECESTLQLVMQKHRNVVTKLAKKLTPHYGASAEQLCGKNYENSISEKIVDLSRLLHECLIDGECISNHDQELIARLKTENACLRELLNISAHNEPNITRQFLDRTSNDGHSNCSNGPIHIPDSSSEEGRDGASTPTENSVLHNSCSEKDIRRNSVLVKKIPDTAIKKNVISHVEERKQSGK